MISGQEQPVRVRYAPSPTGHWHIGGVRSALFNWLFARQHGGKFIVRIEDTDTERSEKEFEVEIFDVLAWLKLDWDEGPESEFGPTKGDYGPYRQSERLPTYKNYLSQLIADRKAYYCYCTKEELEAERQSQTAAGLPPKYGGRCRDLTVPPAGKKPQTIRFRVPEAPVEFSDLVRGKVTFDAGLFGDIVIAKNLDAPLYNFAAVVDDAEMRISHVIRGEEHLSNTPKQILLAKALGLPSPVFAHVPLILNPDRSKMSKRFAETSILSYRERGYLAPALLNFLALLGWHPKHDLEKMPLDQIIHEFDLTHVQKAGAVFNEEKLDWLNKEYLKDLSDKELADVLEDTLERLDTKNEFSSERRLRTVAAVRERMRTLSDFETLAAFFFALPKYEPELLSWKTDTKEQTLTTLEKIFRTVESLDSTDFAKEKLPSHLESLIGERGKGNVLWPLRVALSGSKASPDPYVIADVLGKQEVLTRLEVARHSLAEK